MPPVCRSTRTMCPVDNPRVAADAQGASDALDSSAAEAQLCAGLRIFIARELERALGPEFADVYAPPNHADALALCIFVDKRWLAVFTDSALSNRRHLLHAARDALRARSSNLPRQAEALLAAIGAHSRSALVKEPPPPPPPADVMDTEPAPVSAVANAVVPAGARMDVDSGAGAARVPVVLDGANIGWRYGRTRFSMTGAAVALAHFQQRGHPAALVLPEGRLIADGGDDEEKAAMNWILGLQGTDALVVTPASDYDDTYIVHVARRAGAVVVSNDRFADIVYQAVADGHLAEKSCREYLAKCRVSFAFHGKAFMPNPAFDFKRAAAVARRLAIPPD